MKKQSIARGISRLVPTFVIEYILKIVHFVTGDLNINIPSIGLKSSPFGAAVVESLVSADCFDGSVPLLGNLYLM